ncbi:hypothetical protein SAMN04488057_1062 [Cyclobacterium lianum]|uniref:Prevent-host-death family protein n=2 Tax=Cyclobacterium lianum TaxID=388280 RepID=A0A1M7NQY2_9BACT|nr:hypothetical protein SAMN04488057_1062 [Cyclobacterium lianum]
MTVTMHIGEFKARFSEVVEMIKGGVVIKVVKGKSGQLVGYFGKEMKPAKPKKRKLGFFKDQGIEISKSDMEWTDEELSEMGI